MDTQTTRTLTTQAPLDYRAMLVAKLETRLTNLEEARKSNARGSDIVEQLVGNVIRAYSDLGKELTPDLPEPALADRYLTALRDAYPQRKPKAMVGRKAVNSRE